MLAPEILLSTLLWAAALAVAWYACGDWYERLVDKIEADFRVQLRRLRIPAVRLREWLYVWTILVLLTLFFVSVSLESPTFGLLAAVLMVGLPWYILRRMAEARRQKIEDQLADSMVALAQGIKAGLSLGQSLQILAEQCPRPICLEFRQIVGEFGLGKPLENCLLEARDRLKSENFGLFAAAMLASRESGGRLNETVERIAYAVLEMQRIDRKIRSETAQARTSAVYMALTPIAILALYYMFIDPVNTERLFTTLPGQIMLSASVILMIVAYLWARKILNPDV